VGLRDLGEVEALLAREGEVEVGTGGGSKADLHLLEDVVAVGAGPSIR